MVTCQRLDQNKISSDFLTMKPVFISQVNKNLNKSCWKHLFGRLQTKFQPPSAMLALKTDPPLRRVKKNHDDKDLSIHFFPKIS